MVQKKFVDYSMCCTVIASPCELIPMVTVVDWDGAAKRKEIDETKGLEPHEAETANECLAAFNRKLKRLGVEFEIPEDKRIVFLRGLMACYWLGWESVPPDD